MSRIEQRDEVVLSVVQSDAAPTYVIANRLQIRKALRWPTYSIRASLKRLEKAGKVEQEYGSSTFAYMLHWRLPAPPASTEEG